MLHGKLFYVMVILAVFIPISTLMQMRDVSSISALIGGSGNAEAGSEMTLSILNMLTAIFLCVFIGKEYSSGFIKNVIPVHANKFDYLISKALIALICNIVFIAAYLIIVFVLGFTMGLPTGIASIPGFILFILEKLLLSIPTSMLIIMINLIFCRRYGWSVVVSFFAAMGIVVLLIQSCMLSAGLDGIVRILNFTVTGAGLYIKTVPSLSSIGLVILVTFIWTIIYSLIGNYLMKSKDVL